MEKKRLHTDPIKVKHELQKVADELGLPLNCKVSIDTLHFSFYRLIFNLYLRSMKEEIRKVTIYNISLTFATANFSHFQSDLGRI